ncbi:response regulator [Paenibacillus segetis]|uniref:Transcriptional regulatory protein YesN n=1 Tax=Paenibacillus segetis TaxID=1325360 RepID=A0ABQ1YFK6_9BACL|nr:response regulator [Paenibacillus segetis]GGH23236.1 putative transcriptional regulatory protein YesN [Paenibacillus segetis]
MPNYKVLIIDDEPWSRQVVQALGAWDKMNMTVIGEAEDGKQGLRLIEELQPHIVITDMRMPGIEGVELLRQISAEYPEKEIIVMSGYDDFVYLKEAIRSRAVEYLLKPINENELNDALLRCSQNLQAIDRLHEELPEVPFFFTDRIALEEYLAYRQRIFGHLLTLNKSMVSHEFAKLAEFMERMTKDSDRAKPVSQISHDFFLMLSKFVSEHDMELGQIWMEEEVKSEDNKTKWSSFNEAVAELSRVFADIIDRIEGLQKNRNRLNLGEVKLYIEQHYQDDISLETIASHFFVSKEHLSRSFKNITGENISDFIVRMRMEKARELIVEEGLPIKHAAQLSGYDDLAYFYRVFKKHYGMPPGSLRKED